MKRLRALLKSLVRMVALFVVMSFLTIISCQSKLIYFPRKYDPSVIARLQDNGAQLWEYRTSQGRQTAFYQPAKANPAAAPEFLWLVFGGNGSVALDYANMTGHLNDRFAFLYVDYPSYGLCEGAPNPATILESIRALKHEIETRISWGNVSWPKRSGIFGHSLGAAAGLMAVEELGLSAAVVCSPFTTMSDMARVRFGVSLDWFNRHRYDNRARLAVLSQRGTPVRIFHGVEDSMIPVAMSRELAASYGPNVTLTEIAGAEHNDIIDIAGEQIAAAMEESAEKHGVKATVP